MTNAFRYYLPTRKYRIINEQEFLDIARSKMMHTGSLKQTYINKDLTKLTALKIFQRLNIQVVPVNAFEIKLKDDDVALKTVEKMEEDIAKYIFDHSTVDYSAFSEYLAGSKDAMIDLLKNSLNYKGADEEKTLEDFIDKEVYFTTNMTYKRNYITVTLSSEKFICNKNEKAIYKYQANIIDEDGYKFSFKKGELFKFREEAIEECKKLIDEHYNLPIKNGKIQKIMVRKDANGTIIVFWPEITTDNNYIISNDLIGTHDLAGETKTSMSFFDSCQDVTMQELAMVKRVIQNCLKIQTYNVKNI